MIGLDITLLVALYTDLKGAVLFAVEHAAAIKDLATAYYLSTLASKNLRKENKNK
ncbi:hypothetical protein [Pseudoalteromonas piscicida]|uniref:hypothetical protein n=1 Tax=Pseudoalteromonas piscicida TaxID=43662 RepID=UPI0012FD5E8A|nr:hypothetical protein [Pseudoalteromonas piscicida]